LPKGLESVPADVRDILRLSLYQLLFLESIPHHAVLDQAVRLTRWAGFDGLTGLVNGVLRNVVREARQVRFPDRHSSPASYLATFHSHPVWLVERWLARFGFEETERLLAANNTRPLLTVRTNILRTMPEDLERLFESEGAVCEPSRHCRESLIVRSGGDPAKLPGFTQGFFTVQDTSSTLVGKILPVSPGTRALDLCAAPGGKCTHLAERMADRSIIVAVDRSSARLAFLRENIARLRLGSITCVVADGRDFRAGDFDAVLVDAPCTGTGVLSRRADLRWRLKESDIETLSSIQHALLQNAATLVKRGGCLLYSTCSLEPEENAHAVEKFLSESGDFRMQAIQSIDPILLGASGCLETLPHRHAMDGVFACLFVKGYQER
jgi:16S rRNA (cytosine967-C5)-methyltransferase